MFDHGPSLVDIRLLGYAIGRRCVVALLGMGLHRFRKALVGTPDLRFSWEGHRVAHEKCKEAHADAFFAQLYITSGETFPTGSSQQVFVPYYVYVYV